MSNPPKKAKLDVPEETSQVVSTPSLDMPFPPSKGHGGDDLLRRLGFVMEKNAAYLRAFMSEVVEMQTEMDGMCHSTHSLLYGGFDNLVEEFYEKTKKLREYMEITWHDLYCYSKSCQLKGKESTVMLEMAAKIDEALKRCKRMVHGVSHIKKELEEQQREKRTRLNLHIDQFFKKRMIQLQADHSAWAKEWRDTMKAVNENYCKKVKTTLSEDVKLFAKEVRTDYRFPKSILLAHTETSTKVYDGAHSDAESVLRKTAKSHSRKLQSICKKAYEDIEKGLLSFVGEYKLQQLQDLYPLIPKWRKVFNFTYTISEDFSDILTQYHDKLGLAIKAREQASLTAE